MSDSPTPWTAECKASLFLTVSWSLPKFMSIESVMLSTISSSATLFSSFEHLNICYYSSVTNEWYGRYFYFLSAWGFHVIHLLLISAQKACGQRAQVWIITISPPTVSRDHLVVPLPFLCDWCSFSTVLWSFLHPVFSVFMVASLEWVSSYLSCFGVNVLPEDKVLCLLGILEIFQPFFCWLLLQSNLCLTFSHHFPSLILLLIFVF